MYPTLNSKKAFTLVELSIALVVIGLLTAVAIPVAIGVTRNQKIRQVESELENIRELLISYYNINGKLPSHGTTNTIPTSQLGIPDQYKNDPIRGIPYLYYADTVTGGTDTIYVDNVPLGGISAVIISVGPNGKFDGENSIPADRRFESTGTGDFDDILYYVCELDLKQGIQLIPEGYCESYNLLVRNKNVNEVPLYVRIISTATNTYSISYGSTLSLTNLEPYTCVQVNTGNNWTQTRTYNFNISAYNEGSDCTVEVILYGLLSGTTHPLITGDISR